MGRKKEEAKTYVAYYYDKMGMIQRLHFEGAGAVDLIADGISDSVIKEQANRGMYPTLEALLAYT